MVVYTHIPNKAELFKLIIARLVQSVVDGGFVGVVSDWTRLATTGLIALGLMILANTCCRFGPPVTRQLPVNKKF